MRDGTEGRTREDSATQLLICVKQSLAICTSVDLQPMSQAGLATMESNISIVTAGRIIKYP